MTASWPRPSLKLGREDLFWDVDRMAARALSVIAMTAFLVACGAAEESACCAIEPKAMCEGALAGRGISRAEIELLMGAADMVCPSGAMSEARIHEIADIWATLDACNQTRGHDRLLALDAGRCPVRAMASAPALPPGVDETVAATCAAGLVARGTKENELWLVLGAPEKVCPTGDISEARIRDIIGKDWGPAGCTQFTPALMLHALDAHACAKPQD